MSRSDYADVVREILPITEYNGVKTVLPPGMDERRFREVMAALPPERLEGAQAQDGRPITPEVVARGGFTLHAVGPGRYVMRYQGYDVLDSATGRAFRLDLNGAEPARAQANTLSHTPAERARGNPGARMVRPIEGWEAP